MRLVADEHIAPGFQPEFIEQKRGLCFRLLDDQGRVRSKLMTINRATARAVDRKTLEAMLHAAGFPAKF